MRHFFCLFPCTSPGDNCSRGGVPKPPAHVWATFTPAQRPGGPADLVAMRSVRLLARGLLPPAALGRAEQRAQKSPHPPARSLDFHPQKTPFPPPTPNDVSLERPRNASCWIGSEHHGIFPRSFSGHCPSSCAPLPPAYSYIRAYRRSVPGPVASQKSRQFTHRLWGNAFAVFRSSDQIAVCDSNPPSAFVGQSRVALNLCTVAVKEVFTSEEEMCS